MAQEPNSIDSILLSNEFKSEQRAQLSSMPSSSVADLTTRLNSVSTDDPKTGRLFEFLTVKLKQFEDELPVETKTAAVEALRAKATSKTPALTEYRQKLLGSVQAQPLVVPPTQPDKLEPALQPPLKPSPTPKPPGAKPVAANEEPTSSTPWSIIVVLIVAAGGLLWLLLKRRS